MLVFDERESDTRADHAPADASRSSEQATSTATGTATARARKRLAGSSAVTVDGQVPAPRRQTGLDIHRPPNHRLLVLRLAGARTGLTDQLLLAARQRIVAKGTEPTATHSDSRPRSAPTRHSRRCSQTPPSGPGASRESRTSRSARDRCRRPAQTPGRPAGSSAERPCRRLTHSGSHVAPRSSVPRDGA